MTRPHFGGAFFRRIIMSMEFWAAYVATIFVASIIPGPSMLLALAHGVRYGARRTIFTGLGNTVASMLQAVAALAGLGMLLLASSSLFLFVKLAGAVYLVWLGVGILRNPECFRAEEVCAGDGLSCGSMFMQGFFVAAGNPKAVIFFTALFPQFMTAESAGLTGAAAMVGVLGVVAFVCMMVYALGGGRLALLLRRPRVARWFGRGVGASFVGAGAAVAASNR